MPAYSSSTLEPYARVLVLTQGMINAALEALQERYPNQLKRFKDIDPDLGEIVLDLLAPKILIKDENSVYFQLW